METVVDLNSARVTEVTREVDVKHVSMFDGGGGGGGRGNFILKHDLFMKNFTTFLMFIAIG